MRTERPSKQRGVGACVSDQDQTESKKSMKTMRICDRVHGEITIPPFVAAIATHKIFHRLDSVRQLGGCAFVYPSATHTRREHSLGVCHLAGDMGLHLKERYPNLVDDDDILCLQIAGLAHDMGHGPFSHTFEDYMHEHVKDWSHEDSACVLLEKVFMELVSEYDPFKKGTEQQHFRTIQLMISGIQDDDVITFEEFNRYPDQRFLFEIVHNQTNGIDVDKWDYLCRDALCAFGATRQLSLARLIGATRLVEKNKFFTIAFDENVAFEMAEMYALRARLHRQVYQHHGVILVESLIVELMNAIDRVSLPQDRFFAIAQDKDRFTSFVDASILCHPLLQHEAVIPYYECLLNWTNTTRTRSTIVLHTLPLCSNCGRETELTASFCTHCGASTKDRTGLVSGSGVEVAPACYATGESITARLCKHLKRDDVRVSVRDIKCGKGIVVEDPHGRKWMDYDPLKCVTFVGKDDRPSRVEATSHHAPRYRHVRTARCYVMKMNIGKEELSEIDIAFVHMCEGIGFMDSGIFED
ncbi:MAG: hypothetical protein CBC12_07420 [Candidatus Puniceispirillum sp. TMED52]|nr:MAG: hypothetical protein CBC12_07420 [Candidatus Puniceispirillum sp. TMED52]RPF82027.1 MAG: HD domain-containing protein [Rhodothermaceae bacterium TMED105]